MAEKETVRYTIPPGMTSPIVLKTIPDAVCRLGEEGQSDRALTMYTDPDGLVRFHVLPISEKPMKIIAVCKAADKSERYPVELHPGSKTAPDKPAPPIYEPKLRMGDFVRPALSQQEMLRLSDAELLKRGYPLRPARPVLFNSWQKQVSKPVTVFKPHIISSGASILESAKVSPMRTATGVSGLKSPNWCGYSLTNDNDPNNGYALVFAEFQVPTTVGGPNQGSGQIFATLFWVGYGGISGGVAPPFPFVAAGFEIQALAYESGQIIQASPWIQNAEGVYFISDFDINPGDQIDVEVYRWNAAREPSSWRGSPDQQGTDMGYTFYNYYTQRKTGASYPYPYTLPINGTVMAVDWIASKEAGGVGPARYAGPLICSIYPAVYAAKCTAPGTGPPPGYPPSYETYFYNSDNNIQFTMVDANGNVIGTAGPDSMSPENLYYNLSYSSAEPG